MKKFLLTAFLIIIGSQIFAQERIAVFPFEDMENVLTQNLAKMFYQEFSNEFKNRMPDKSVVPREDVDRLISTEYKFQLSDFSARTKTAEMHRVLNGTQILSGRIGKLGNNLRIIVSLYTYPELDQLPGGTSLSVANVDELFSKIPELVQQMQDRIARGSTSQSIPEGLLYEIVDSKTVNITSYIGNAATVNIPSHILGFSVTSIGERAFEFCGSLNSVTIPSSVTTIGRYAFAYGSLTSVTIPSSVTSIGERAFDFCENLTSITVDNRNPVYASIDGVLFDKKIGTLIEYPRGRKQKTYVIPSSVTSIGQRAFYLCKSLTSVTIPSSVTYIGKEAFHRCENLTSVTIPSSVTYIDLDEYNSVFAICSSLTSITVDNRNPMYASIDGVLFDKNIKTLIQYPQGRNQKTYVIPSSVTSIRGHAFSDSENLTSVTIPSSVTSVGQSAFYRCNSLTSVNIPSSVTSIGHNAFNSCGLTSVTISNSITSIEEFTFANNRLTSVTIPNSVTTIKDGAFMSNRLTSVIIPNSVTSITGGGIFYESEDGGGTRSGTFAHNRLTSVTIPNSITTITGDAFKSNQLTSITIGANVEIGDVGVFENGFVEFYYAQGRKAGTYTYRNKSWSVR